MRTPHPAVPFPSHRCAWDSTEPTSALTVPTTSPVPTAPAQPFEHLPEPIPCPWWAPRPIDAAVGPLDEEEISLLRLARTDEQVLVNVLGLYWPIDQVRTRWQRMAALRRHLPDHGVLTGAAAWWVYTGGPPPAYATVSSLTRAGRSATVVLRRTRVPDADQDVVAGRRITTPERTVIDLMRTLTTAQAVALLLQARAIGIEASGLLSSLSRRRGAGAAGRPRLARIIRAVYAVAW